VLIAPERKCAAVQQRCDHQQAVLVGESARVVAVAIGVAGVAMKDQQQ
jgi:hypothetical protein